MDEVLYFDTVTTKINHTKSYLESKLRCYCDNPACKGSKWKDVPRGTMDCPKCGHLLVWMRKADNRKLHARGTDKT